MKHHLALHVTTATRSFTRTILDLTAQSDVISFAGGLPDATLFPKETIQKYSNILFETSNNTLFQYSNASGVEALKCEIAKTYEHTTHEEIMLTNGSQQGLDLVCKTFLNNGDCIIVEDPSYLAALGLFHMYNVTIKTAPLTPNGVDTHALEALFRDFRPKFFYTIPVFQNPTGYSYTLETKREVVKLAQKHHVILLEDNPYEALRYEGNSVASFATLLPYLTISLGTFSKTLAPDFRIGWLKAPKEIIHFLTCSKESTDLQNSKFFQTMCAMMMQDGELQKHTHRLIDAYRCKRDAMVKALQDCFHERVDVVIPEGGMFLWVHFKAYADSMKLFEKAIEKGVAFVPGSVFFADKRVSAYGRLNYTHSSIERIQTGIKKLHEASLELT